MGESPYNLLQQVNAALAQSCQPFVAWRLEWVSGEVDRLWPEGVPQIRNEHGSAYVTGYAHDDSGNLVYLGMVGHKTVLESIRATVQARQRKKLFLQGRPVYPLPTHYSQTWQHLPDYGAYHATLIADPALPGKWQPGEDVAYMLVFEGDLSDGRTTEEHASMILPARLSESLPIPILQEWGELLWEAGIEHELIALLTTSGDNPAGYWVQLTETAWTELLSWLLKEERKDKNLNKNFTFNVERDANISLSILYTLGFKKMQTCDFPKTGRHLRASPQHLYQHQPDDARLICVHMEHGDIFNLPGLITVDLRRTVEALQPFHINSTLHLNSVVCRWIEYWLCVFHRSTHFCGSSCSLLACLKCGREVIFHAARH
jgi:hypothetical protein